MSSPSRLPVLLLLSLRLAAAPPPTTHYERSGHLETPRLAETLQDCRRLAAASPWIRVTSFGQSAQGRPLPLLVVDKDRRFDPASVRASGKAVLLIQACIHPGEPEGKDAGLLFLRDLAVTRRHADLLDRLSVLFIPVFNVDGHERFSPYNRINQNGPKAMGWRTTANNLNLNRDHLKADAPEMQAWLTLLRAWDPDFFLDCHTTDGADYQYVLTYGADTGHFLEEGLAGWMRDTFLPDWTARMSADGMPVFPYVSYREWHDPRSGLVEGAGGPMYSTGYLAARNRPSLLLETHMLKPYHQRVEATRAALLHTARLLHREKDTLRRRLAQADHRTATPDFRAREMPLAFKPTEEHEPVDFLGFDYTCQKSELTGGDWFTYDPTRPAVFRIPFYRHLAPKASARVPAAYLVPPEWREVIARLDLHGIRYRRLAAERTLEVQSHRFDAVRFATTPQEGRQRVASLTVQPLTETRTFPPGTAVVPTAQPLARLIVHLLEPASEDSLLRWGFFNAIFEQKEYGESYVLEPLARRMLAQDPALGEAFVRRKAEDPAFAKDPEAMLNWFYLRSPWGDPRMNLDPVGRIHDASVARALGAR